MCQIWSYQGHTWNLDSLTSPQTHLWDGDCYDSWCDWFFNKNSNSKSLSYIKKIPIWPIGVAKK